MCPRRPQSPGHPDLGLVWGTSWENTSWCKCPDHGAGAPMSVQRQARKEMCTGYRCPARRGVEISVLASAHRRDQLCPGADLQENRTRQARGEASFQARLLLVAQDLVGGALHTIPGCLLPRTKGYLLSPEPLSPPPSRIAPLVPSTPGPCHPTPAALFFTYRGFRSSLVSPWCGLVRRFFLLHLSRS